MKKIKFENWCDVAPVNEKEREKWARELVAEIKAKNSDEFEEGFCICGDSMVYVEKDREGFYQVWDCLVRRHAIISPR